MKEIQFDIYFIENFLKKDKSVTANFSVLSSKQHIQLNQELNETQLLYFSVYGKSNQS
jgi:hypothetical protein